MSSGQITAIVIVAIVMVASVIRAVVGVGIRHHRFALRGDDRMQAENQRLREEVGDLKERLKVLERITVDKENSLSREIDALRDR